MTMPEHSGFDASYNTEAHYGERPMPTSVMAEAWAARAGALDRFVRREIAADELHGRLGRLICERTHTPPTIVSQTSASGLTTIETRFPLITNPDPTDSDNRAYFLSTLRRVPNYRQTPPSVAASMPVVSVFASEAADAPEAERFERHPVLAIDALLRGRQFALPHVGKLEQAFLSHPDGHERSAGLVDEQERYIDCLATVACLLGRPVTLDRYPLVPVPPEGSEN